MADFDPLVDAPPPEIPLENAPLVRVLAQVRFPAVTSVASTEFVAPFQEALRGSYPILDQSRPVVGSAAIGGEIWRFSDEAEQWRVSLTPNFVALETTDYRSRTDLLERLSRILQAVAEHVRPARADRIGLRYVDRIRGEELKSIADFVRPEIRGVLATVLSDHLLDAVNASTFEVPSEEAKLRARWGWIPPEATIDPAAIEPIVAPSWVLDLDMFTNAKHPFDHDRISQQLSRFAARIYGFFRWAVTDEFLRNYGGEV